LSGLCLVAANQHIETQRLKPVIAAIYWLVLLAFQLNVLSDYDFAIAKTGNCGTSRRIKAPRRNVWVNKISAESGFHF
jgi:hypothetical protein